MVDGGWWMVNGGRSKRAAGSEGEKGENLLLLCQILCHPRVLLLQIVFSSSGV